MNYFLITLHGFLRIFTEKYNGRILYDFTRKKNIKKLKRKEWNTVLFDGGLEKNYFRLFGIPEKFFPGESFLRALVYDLKIEDDKTLFLIDFLTQDDGKIVETEVPLSVKEKQLLLYSIPQIPSFSFFTTEKDSFLLSEKKFPFFQIAFPLNLKGKLFKDFLPEKFPEIKNLVLSSIEVLENHTVNKVRKDLGENIANLIWVWGMGGKKTIPVLKEIYQINPYYLPISGFNGLPKFLGFQIEENIRKTEEESLWWIEIFSSEKESPQTLIQNFEYIDEIVGKIAETFENFKILILVDGYFSKNIEIKRMHALYLCIDENFKPRKFKKGSSLFLSFLARNGQGFYRDWK